MITGVAAISGCGKSDAGDSQPQKPTYNEKEVIVGKWKANLDLTGMIKEKLAVERELDGYLKIDGANLPMIFEFNGDGTFKWYPDESEINKQRETLLSSVKSAVGNYFIEYFGLENSEEPLDEVLKKYSISLNEIAEGMIKGFFENFEVFKKDGVYTVEDGRAYIGTDEQTLGLKDKYIGFEIENENTVRVIDIVADGVDQNLKEMFPAELKRQ